MRFYNSKGFLSSKLVCSIFRKKWIGSREQNQNQNHVFHVTFVGFLSAIICCVSQKVKYSVIYILSHTANVGV